MSVPRNCATKTDILWGSYRIYIFDFLKPLRIFVPCLEILFLSIFIFYYVYLCTVQIRVNLIGILMLILG